MAANPNLLGNLESGRTELQNEAANEVADEVTNEAAHAVMPRAAAAVPETRRAEQAALLRPKITVARLQGPLT